MYKVYKSDIYPFCLVVGKMDDLDEINKEYETWDSKVERNMSKCCQFFSWGKNNKYKKCHAPSQPACKHFEEIVND